MKDGTVAWPAWCCQTCGEVIGYVGRFFQWLCVPLHKCGDPICFTCAGSGKQHVCGMGACVDYGRCLECNGTGKRPGATRP